MFERILVPLDGSDLAETVLPAVQELAGRFGSDVVLLQAIPTIAQLISQNASPEYVGVGVDAAESERDALLASDAQYLSAVSERLKAGGLSVATEVVEGSPATAILDYAGSHAISLIAMSTHGRSGLGRLVFGSVAEGVLRHATVPLLLIRPQS